MAAAAVAVKAEISPTSPTSPTSGLILTSSLYAKEEEEKEERVPTVKADCRSDSD